MSVEIHTLDVSTKGRRPLRYMGITPPGAVTFHPEGATRQTDLQPQARQPTPQPSRPQQRRLSAASKLARRS